MTVADLPSLTGITYLERAEVIYGIDIKPAEAKSLSKWQQDAHPWTFILYTSRSKEEFWFFTGKAWGEPTVPELIHSLVLDHNMLESEPEEISYPVGKAIEANSAKARKLFGPYWDTLLQMSEEEIEEVF